MSKSFDVIIAGGGPAGSTAAILLAQYGYKVLLLERDVHPKFHIGESMMPQIDPIMQRMGFDWGAGNLPKSGGDFIDEASGKKVSFLLTGKYRTYQIERAGFDAKLFGFAGSEGVQAHQQEGVLDVDCRIGEVTVKTAKATYAGRYFIDATGRNVLMGRKHKSIQRIENLGRFALYNHFRNVSCKIAEGFFKVGNIKVFLGDIGWTWVIPLIGNQVSVGLIVQKNSLESINKEKLFQTTLDRSPFLSELLKGSECVGSLKAEADFSYVNNKRYGTRYICCGDAAGFLDPIFSSGVFFAVKSAEVVADRLHQALQKKQEADPNLHWVDAEYYNHGFQTVHMMIERFYHSGLVQNLFFEADREQRIKREITAIMAGDLWCKNNRFQEGLLKGRKRLESFT